MTSRGTEQADLDPSTDVLDSAGSNSPVLVSTGFTIWGRQRWRNRRACALAHNVLPPMVIVNIDSQALLRLTAGVNSWPEQMTPISLTTARAAP
jgi:hypothetical protein